MAPSNTIALPLLMALSFANDLLAVETKERTFEGKRYMVSAVDLKKEKLHLFLGDGRGKYFNNFENIDRWLAERKKKLVFAMNAGMFHPGFAPVGLYVDHGQMIGKLNLDNAEGNFFLKPNGVFAVTDAGARVMESSRFPALAAARGIENVQLATQSGPLLVIDGKLHPAFRERSESRLFRNGVGVISPTRVMFAISNEPVNFHEFARFFRDGLRVRKCALSRWDDFQPLHARAQNSPDPIPARSHHRDHRAIGIARSCSRNPRCEN